MVKLPPIGAAPNILIQRVRDMGVEIAVRALRKAKGPMNVDRKHLGVRLVGRHQAFKIPREHVNFDIDAIADGKLSQSRRKLRMGNNIHGKQGMIDLVDGQRNAIDGNRPLGRQESRQLGRRVELKLQAVADPLLGGNKGDSIDMAGNNMAAEFIAHAQRRLQIYLGSGVPLHDRGLAESFGRNLNLKSVVRLARNGQANSGARDGTADFHVKNRKSFGFNLERPIAALGDIENRSNILNYTSEHREPLRKNYGRREKRFRSHLYRFFFQRVDKIFEIGRRAECFIDRSVADISDGIKLAQRLHHMFADLSRADFNLS